MKKTNKFNEKSTEGSSWVDKTGQNNGRLNVNDDSHEVRMHGILTVA